MSAESAARAPEGRPEPKGRLKPPATITPAGTGAVGAVVTPAHWHKSLRNPNINYRAGWWAVTVQVARNKSLLGAIVGKAVVLNALGRAVEACWRELPAKYPGLELFDFVVMPNHFHALLRIHNAPANHAHQLGFLMSRFKGGSSFIYGQMRRAGEVEDIGEQLWQRDYWDCLVSSEEAFRGWQKYIRENPANWSSDRYGAYTAYAWGDTELLNRPRVAFVASQGFYASALKPRKLWARGAAKAARYDNEGGAGDAARYDNEGGAGNAARYDNEGGAGDAARYDNGAGNAARCDNKGGAGNATRYDNEGGAGNAGENRGGAEKGARVLISTFTSAQEREALRRALAKKRPLIAVFPAGIPEAQEMVAGLAAAIDAGEALAISPQPPGSRLNKKIATWCNEFVLKNADEIWAGDLAPNGMLAQMLAGLYRSVRL